ncbi:MAG: hypothetical protein ACLSIL_19970 [Enterococcus casseliflavus]
MVKIPVKTTQMPIEIGEHTFHIDTSEKGAESFWKLVAGYAEKSSKITKKVGKRTDKTRNSKKKCTRSIRKSD